MLAFSVSLWIPAYAGMTVGGGNDGREKIKNFDPTPPPCYFPNYPLKWAVAGRHLPGKCRPATVDKPFANRLSLPQSGL